MKQEICKCGHGEFRHWVKKKMGKCYVEGCKCKKFEPLSKGCGKTFDKFQPRETEVCGALDYLCPNCKPKSEKTGFNLSKKISDYFDRDEMPNRKKDIQKILKEFINRIKMTMLFTPSPKERGNYIRWLGCEIDKIAGDDLVK